MMKRRLLLVCLIFAVSVTAYGQKEIYDDSSWDLRERGYLGLGLSGLSFGTYASGNFFSIGVSGLSGYMLTPNLSAGIGLEYQYTSYSYLKLRNHVYGGYPFVRYNIRDFFIQADYTMYSVQVNIQDAGERQMMDRAFIGVGITSPTRGRAMMNFLVSYDLLHVPGTSRWGSPLATRLFFTF